MIPRKQEIRSPKFCSKGSCFPPITASETSSEGPSQTYVCQKSHSMWYNCHPFLPVTTDFQFYIKHAASLPPLHFLLHTSPGPFTHPFHFKSGSRILKGMGHIWGGISNSNRKANFKTSGNSVRSDGNLVGQESFPEGQSEVCLINIDQLDSCGNQARGCHN